MDIFTALANVNYLAVLVAAIAHFLLGSVWYSPVMFLRDWVDDNGFDTNRKPGINSMLKIFVTSFLMYGAMAIVLATVIGTGAEFKDGVNMGLYIGLGLIATSTAAHYVYENKSLRLFLINAGYGVAGMVIMGAIVGAWQ